MTDLSSISTSELVTELSKREIVSEIIVNTHDKYALYNLGSMGNPVRRIIGPVKILLVKE